jgi:Helitron helicase-like domain at N-terminus
VPIDFRDHIVWSLQYFDRRFRKHETFPFFVFGILQRREALLTARLQMNKHSFERDASIISTITREKMALARKEEEQNVPISDPAIRLLRKTVRGALARVIGSNENRYQMRGQIWSTCVFLGPPSLWITINPSDLNNPIAQILAGENIDLEFLTSNVDSRTRAKNIADDPYAAANFFHFLIRTIMENLLQIKVDSHRVKSGMGILGQVAAYFGLVESQGRGTLHLHMILWLCDTPRSDVLQDLLKTTSFRQRVASYIEANVRAYLPGLESAESVQAIRVDKEVVCRRPPDPEDPNYDVLLKNDELALARAEQIHVCKARCCLVMDRQGSTRCKCRAPFPCANEDYVLESGEWGPKRLFGQVNGWNPGILVNARCNNDIKLLTNGGETKNITYYVTTYAAKKQGRSYNLSAVLANGFNYHEKNPITQYISQLKENSRILIFRLLQAINRQQELAAPLVISYLMGWGDVYRSHTYTPIYWTSFVSEILRAFPSLADQVSLVFHYSILSCCIQIILLFKISRSECYSVTTKDRFVELYNKHILMLTVVDCPGAGPGQGHPHFARPWPWPSGPVRSAVGPGPWRASISWPWPDPGPARGRPGPTP